ncbi:MAG TPA: hypothetical protein VEB64_17220 [Azospirillaceae bacterium]|nr:hypothetical protein [Azospirillaceae bacterium]
MTDLTCTFAAGSAASQNGASLSNVLAFHMPEGFASMEADMEFDADHIPLSAIVVDLMKWRERNRPDLRSLPSPRPAFVPDMTTDTDLPAYAYDLERGEGWQFPPSSAASSVQQAWAEAVAPLNDRDRRVAAAVFCAEMHTAGLKPENPSETTYRHLVARLLYRDELVWRRHHGAFHAFARSILIRFAMALSRQGVA